MNGRWTRINTIEIYGDESSSKLNRIYYGDNLQIMKELLSEYAGKIKMIYLDPPYDSAANYKRRIYVRDINNPSKLIGSFEEEQYTDVWTNIDYLQFMEKRLIIMKELLSDDGTIFLHCDWHRSHYLKIILDEIFGIENFRNEIIWAYSTSGRSKDRFAQKHDTIFSYGKTKRTFFNVDESKVPYTEEYIKSHFRDRDDQDRVCRKRFDAGKWRIYYPDAGMIPNDVWMIPYENSMSKRRVGYPTQKPELLLERLIKSATVEGDLVLDPFMGSGTTQNVSMKLRRNFIGIDDNYGAVYTTIKRLSQTLLLCGQTGFRVFNTKDCISNFDNMQIMIENDTLVIKSFYPSDLMDKLSHMNIKIEDWKQVVDSIVIDWNYDGKIMRPSFLDYTDKKEFVKGSYHIPENAQCINLRVTDIVLNTYERVIDRR